jgi:hypothetical protein
MPAGCSLGRLAVLCVIGSMAGSAAWAAVEATPAAVAAPAPSAASASGAAPDPGYALVVGQPRLGAYSLRQESLVTTAGDHVKYVTTVNWRFVVMPLAVTPEHAQVAVSVLHADATLDGPGSIDHVDTDSDDSTMRQDPLFGHLYALRNARLVLEMDPRTGVVLDVSGGDAIAAAVAKDAPSGLGPGSPSPLEAAAKAAYAPQTLARLWTAMLARPGQADYPLGPPLNGMARRTWTGTDYTLALAPGSEHLEATIGQAPVAVAAQVQTLAGTGSQGLGRDLVGTSAGTLHVVLAMTALTQGAGVEETVTWSLAVQAVGR